MLSLAKANEFAAEWIEDWNSHDIERILAHYSLDIVFSSPFIRKIGADESGCLYGREALSAYFDAALRRFPLLRFHLCSVFSGTETATILYESVNEWMAAETMVLNECGQIKRVWAQYDTAI
jgi:hypothetical protein